MSIRRGTKQLFFDMTTNERVEYLKETERVVGIWEYKLMRVVRENIVKEIQNGHSTRSSVARNGLFRTALTFYTENFKTLLEWKELMKNA